jgi:acyl-CoA thioester hydrolase
MTPADAPFRTRVGARCYEIDSNGHVAGTVLLQWGQHARWELLRAAGVDQRQLRELGLGPVSLEERIRFHHEVTAADEVDVSCGFVWDGSATFRIRQELRRDDGTLVAEIDNVGGCLDLRTRRLVGDPAAAWRAVARSPHLLALEPGA